jgi:hypothetical protein
MRFRSVPVVLALLAVAGGVACSSDSKGQTVAARTGADGGAVPDPPACVFTGTPDKKAANDDAPGMLLTDVRVGSHGCYERVTFELRPRAGEPDGPIGYAVEYRPGPIREDPSDRPLNVKGSAFLVVRLSAAGFDLTRSNAPPTYTGPKVIETAGTTSIAQVAEAGDFEGVNLWVIGLDQQRPFRVTSEGSPARLIVDVSRS